MPSPKTLIVGIIACAVGAIGARLVPAARAAQQPQPISATATADAVTFRNNTTDSRFVIVPLTDQPGAAAIFARNDGEVRMSTKETSRFLVYRVTERSLVREGVITDCRPAECPYPPCPPPTMAMEPNPCPPWRPVGLTELRPKIGEPRPSQPAR